MKEFNVTGVCIPHMHYMVDITGKINEIKKLVVQGKYFSINKARQYGKTTIINGLYNACKDIYFVLKISFEGLGEKAFTSENEFCDSFINLITKRLIQNNAEEKTVSEWESNRSTLGKFENLSSKITTLIENINKEVVLIIDEVDKSSNNQLFLDFLGMLRSKYLDRSEGTDRTFRSVILSGVYDIKNLKLKLRPDAEKKYNSPWNIATGFNVEMSFNPYEISTMLIDYEKDAGTGMDITTISQIIYEYTSGYPFLVSRICKEIDEKLNRNWTGEGIENAVKQLLEEQNTLFDDIVKNVENNNDLDRMANDILMDGIGYSFVQTNPTINLGMVLGLFKQGSRGKVQIHNKVFELLLYNHFSIRQEIKRRAVKQYVSSQFIDEYGHLKIELVLDKFQEIMEEEYREQTCKFVEKEGRLLFLAFIKPIINGEGFYFIEPETRDNLRLDIVITYNKKLYIIELKKWYGKKYEEKGYKQLAGYLDTKKTDTGYMVVFDFRKTGKKYVRKKHNINGKTIYEVVV